MINIYIFSFDIDLSVLAFASRELNTAVEQLLYSCEAFLSNKSHHRFLPTLRLTRPECLHLFFLFFFKKKKKKGKRIKDNASGVRHPIKS
jgi:hypothetical protein